VASFLGESLVQYHYDGNGMRVIKDPSLHDSTVYLFSGSQLLAEYDAGASPLLPNKEYIYQEGRLLGWYDGQAHFELLDHLSSRGTVDAGGTLEERGHFPFGEEWYSTGSNETAQTFTSYTRDDESELDYAGARFYSPHLGRFMSADPVLDSSASPQRLARYTYVLTRTIHEMGSLADSRGLDGSVPHR
jgi:RHS repeat-associated protein